MIELRLIKNLNTPNGKMELKIDLSIPKGEISTFYGESGAGKTSTFRMIGGLLSPDDGHIVANGDTWWDKSKKINIKPQDRKVGFAFQDHALFPNMTVRQNLEYALKNHQTKKEIDDLLKEMELGELQDKKTDMLSGGQKQRVSLARALVQKPSILLLDEPLSALDNNMRIKLQDFILKFHKENKCTILLISHDIKEIVKLSNKVYVLGNGEIIKSGAPSQIFEQGRVDIVKLEGTIKGIQEKGESYNVSISIGNNTISIPMAREDIKGYSLGDTILVNSKITDTTISKKIKK
ncbi:molybdate transport system ATP-binding protein [Saonia flava]|uniref:Molybdate transport system ATP-binding protein n=1 Tax=Saonia flava TaxID=523696 RepID=A0A846R085_9FLAO|nr:ATP-binding cassette domain-containing protein [Saonia flava]NJB72570.1 molybdate transport system ATP-binding protein [Saonia flava]